jgi:hypothetical protein
MAALVERCVKNFNWRYPNYDEDPTTLSSGFSGYGYMAPISNKASGFNELKQIEKDTLCWKLSCPG